MAKRKILVANSSDSDILSYVDLVDGSYSCVEFQHVEALDRIYADGNDVYLRFDSRGGRVAKTMHDGQLPPPEQDYMPAGPRTYPGDLMPVFLSGSDRESVTGNGLKLERERVPNEYGGYDEPGSWFVKKPDGTPVARFEQTSRYIYFAISEGDNRHVNICLNSAWTDVGSVLGCNAVFNEDGSFWIGSANWLGDGLNNMVYKLKFADPMNPVDGTVEVLDAVSVGIVANDWNQIFNDYSPAFVLPNGNMGFGVGDRSFYVFDPVAKTAVFRTSTYVYNPNASIAACIGKGQTGWSSVDNHWDNYSVSMAFTTYDFVARPDLTPVVLESQVFSLGPQVNLWTNTLGTADGKYFVLIDNCRDEGAPGYDPDNPPENTKVDKLVVFDMATGQYTTIDLLGIATHGKICGPKTELNLDNPCVVSLQPYKVEGVINRTNGTKATELVLVDNASMRICGRTASDPVTGAYKFRCYNPGTKSVLARHPVTGGFRIAAQVIPTAE